MIATITIALIGTWVIGALLKPDLAN